MSYYQKISLRLVKHEIPSAICYDCKISINEGVSTKYYFKNGQTPLTENSFDKKKNKKKSDTVLTSHC